MPAGTLRHVRFSVTVTESGEYTIVLLDSTGAGIAGGKAQYYSGGWHDIPGTTGSLGELPVELPDGISGAIPLRMIYAYATQQISHNFLIYPVAVFPN